jgi:RimJ/RimL family protein N-acetyltransferase
MGELVIETATREIIGIINFTRTTHYMGGFELFYRIFESKHREKGLMSKGTMRQARHLKGKHVNLKVYAILKDEALAQLQSHRCPSSPGFLLHSP